MNDRTLGNLGTVAVLGDSMAGGTRDRRSLASRIASGMRKKTGTPFLPLDLSGDGLRGAIHSARMLPDHASEHGPVYAVVVLGVEDAVDDPSPVWWLPDVESLAIWLESFAKVAIVILPSVAKDEALGAVAPWSSSKRIRRWTARVPRMLASIGPVTDGRVKLLDLDSMAEGLRADEVHLRPEGYALAAEMIVDVLLSD